MNYYVFEHKSKFTFVMLLLYTHKKSLIIVLYKNVPILELNVIKLENVYELEILIFPLYSKFYH
jgi:hypothetical protein